MELLIFAVIIAVIISILSLKKTNPKDLYNELEIKDRAITGRQPEDYTPTRRY